MGLSQRQLFKVLISSIQTLKLRRKDGHVLIQLKNLYLSTRSTDNDLLEIRVLGEKILKHANGEVSKGCYLGQLLLLTLSIGRNKVKRKSSGRAYRSALCYYL